MLQLLNKFIPGLPKDIPFFSGIDLFFVIWNNLGWNLLLYLMAFASIPRSTLEAAALDGAGFWKQVTKIAFPLARPMVFVAVSMSLVNALQSNALRPASRLFGNRDGGGLPLYIHREAFSNLNLDSAAVMTWVFFMVMIVMIKIGRAHV